MVEDAITDGRRIAQLLASELSGLATGPLADVTVVDANPELTPTPSGAVAYRVEHAGERAGRVLVRPSAAVVELDRAVPDGEPAAGAGLSVDADAGTIVVERGAAVKPAIDVLRRALV